ncbi:caspase family protein [Saccharothrix sp.]|uniref:caspase, EACC1-associated type n=1 Tax=Saccharothrix sp. TaxID=1873460 RepID=UPI00281283B5|nr:caspase family protein [Saccharothrix sp.]
MRRALLIATDTYGDSTFSALRAPRRDAEELDAVLRDESIGAFDTEVLVNPSAQLLRERVDSVFAEAGRDDMVLLYVSGHGVKDRSGKLVFATTDTVNNRLRSTAVSAQFVRESIDHSLAAQVVVLLDCCYGGAFPSGMLPRATGTVDVVQQFHEARGCVVITASTHIQYAYESGQDRVEGEVEPSVFTKAIIEGLRTGEADLDADGEITDRDLYGYVYERVRRENPDQTPTHSGVLNGDLRIAYAGTPLPRDLPDELRRLLRSSDPALRLIGVRLLGSRADEGNAVARTALEVLAAGPNSDLAAAAARALAPKPATAPTSTEQRSEPAAHGTTAEPTAAADPSAPESAGAETAGAETAEPDATGTVEVLPPWLAGGEPVARPPFAYAVPVGRADVPLAFHPNSALLAAGSIVRSTRTWQQVGRVRSFGARAFSPDGRLFAVATGARVTVYETASWVRVGMVKFTGTEDIRSLSFNHDGTHLAATWARRIAICEKRTGGWVQWLNALPHETTKGFRFSAGSPRAVSAATTNEVSLWDTTTWQRLGGEHLDGVELVAVSEEGTLVAAASRTNVVLWRTSDWTPLVDLRVTFRVSGSPHVSEPLAFSDDLRDVVYRTDEGIEVWDLALGQVMQRIPTDLAAAAFSPDGRFLAGTTHDGGWAGKDVWVWDREGRRTRSKPLPPPAARRIALKTKRRRGRLAAGGLSLATGAVVPATQAGTGPSYVLGLMVAAVLYLLTAAVLKRVWRA